MRIDHDSRPAEGGRNVTVMVLADRRHVQGKIVRSPLRRDYADNPISASFSGRALKAGVESNWSAVKGASTQNEHALLRIALNLPLDQRSAFHHPRPLPTTERSRPRAEFHSPKVGSSDQLAQREKRTTEQDKWLMVSARGASGFCNQGQHTNTYNSHLLLV